MKKLIVINDPELLGRELTNTMTVPNNLRKYIKSNKMVTKYDADISANQSILSIPLLASILPLAWLSGTDIHVKELDKSFQESMDELKLEFKKMYPDAPFTTQIHADNLVKNQIKSINPDERTALLFSGGVDSMYSLLTNLKYHPKLIMHGTRVPESTEYWEKIISTYTELAGRLGLKLHITNTNAFEILHRKKIEHNFHEMLYDGVLWTRLLASLVLIPLTAPISVGRFDRLLIAASFDPTYPVRRHPNVFLPHLDEKMRWANLQVIHDGFIPRTEKIAGVLKEYVKNNELTVHACFQHQFIKRARDKLNCGFCEKCLRMIATLILLDIDPSVLGYSVDDSHFKLLRGLLEKKKLDAENLEIFWKPIQDMIPEKIENDIHGSKVFFEWFRDIDIKSLEKDVRMYRNLYYTLPFPLSKLLDEIYRKVNIKIHDSNPARVT